MKRCLIVDDSDIIRKVARHILDGMGFDVTEAENGEKALEHCKASLPDVVMLDWHMPGMNAIEFLSALRTTFGKKRPAIVYCTTEYDPYDISLAFAAGADDFILKPFSREMIESKFREFAAAS